jgi:exodeoxyribonuclease VII small subunit
MTSTIFPSGVGSTPIEELSYEQAFAELEAIVSALEAEESTLEDALALFERGQGLAHYCAELLDKAELKVQQLSGQDLVDFDSDR